MSAGKSLPIIHFQNRSLPPSAIFIDVATSKLFEVSEETSLWFWRFTICVGRSREDESSTILKHAMTLRDCLELDFQTTLKKIDQMYGQENSIRILQDWKMTLDIVIEEARKVAECSWNAE